MGDLNEAQLRVLDITRVVVAKWLTKTFRRPYGEYMSFDTYRPDIKRLNKWAVLGTFRCSSGVEVTFKMEMDFATAHEAQVRLIAFAVLQNWYEPGPAIIVRADVEKTWRMRQRGLSLAAKQAEEIRKLFRPRFR